MKLLTFTIAFAVMVVLFGRAFDHELASGAGTQEPPIMLEQPGMRYQGKPAVWWAKRAVQARKDANARGRTIKRLQTAQRTEAAHFFAWLRGAECVHSEERGADGWATNTGNGYYGGMQADRSFQRTYAPTYYRRWGTANNWPMWAQLHMSYNGWVARGWQPWPNTARECGLR